MESIPRPLDLQQAFQTEPNFDKYARQILENSKTVATVATPTKITDFLQEFGATFINSIQLQNFQKSLHTNRSLNSSSNSFAFNSSSIDAATQSNTTEMEIEFIPNHIIIDSSSFETMDELQKQLEYDKFMNEVWIGIVLTLILISMIFCVCSCFLYHQFRTWKRNYHRTVVQVQSADIEAQKLDAALDDPVPEYTLVSGLPSYEAALELMQKTPTKSCLIVYPSVFNVFNKNEQNEIVATTTNVQQQQQQYNIDTSITTPLLGNAATIYPKSIEMHAEIDSNSIATNNNNIDLTGISTVCTTVNEKELLELFNEKNTGTNDATKPLEEVLIIKNDKGK